MNKKKKQHTIDSQPHYKATVTQSDGNLQKPSSDTQTGGTESKRFSAEGPVTHDRKRALSLRNCPGQTEQAYVWGNHRKMDAWDIRQKLQNRYQKNRRKGQTGQLLGSDHKTTGNISKRRQMELYQIKWFLQSKRNNRIKTQYTSWEKMCFESCIWQGFKSQNI